VEARRTRLTAIVEWVQRTRPARVLRRYSDANGPILAQGLSWQAVFATFAALWVAFAIAGFWFRQPSPLRDALIEGLTTTVPGLLDTGDGGAIKLDQLLSIGALGWTGAIAAVGLIWTAIGWLGAARAAVRSISGLPRVAGPFLLLKLRDAGLTLIFGIAVLVSAALSLASTAFLGTVYAWIGIDETAGIAPLMTRGASAVVVLAVDWIVLSCFLRFGAGVRTSRRALLEGSGLGALALGLLKLLGGLLLGGATSNPLLASFAAIIGLLIWFNLVNQVILIAAAWTAEAGGLPRGRGRRSELGSSP